MKTVALISAVLLTLINTMLNAQIQKQSSIKEQLQKLERSSGGHIGIAALNTGTNQRIQYRAEESFPMGCTSKVIGVAAILKESMTNSKMLQERIKYTQKDLVNWTPITEKHLADGMTVSELCAAAISYSDNTAMNLLAQKLGGPQSLNSFARSIGDKQFKLDHTWPDEALASPESREDATTPAAMVTSLQKLVLEDELAVPQRELLRTWLINNVTGNERIRAGVPKGWVVGDKTGTGYNYGTTNDVAIIWPPKCAPIVVAIYYSSSKKESPKRNDVLASATRLLINEFANTDQCLRS